jgi:hypothetical protein
MPTMVLHLPTRNCEVDHDDSSVSSTLTVERLNGTKPLQSSLGLENTINATKKAKKSVQFNLSQNMSIVVDSLESEDNFQRWLSAKDYREFKSNAQDASNQIIRIEARNRAPYSYQRVMEHAFTACMLATRDIDEVLPPSEFIHLQRWLEVATSRCGLEKWSIRKVSRDKSSRRRELNKTVQNIQFSRRSANGTIWDHDSTEFLRISCENISRPSRLYARTLATALAAALQSENCKEEQ